MKYLSLHVARRYLTERESSASRTLVAQRKIKHGPEMNSLSILHKKTFFDRSFSSSLDAADGGGRETGAKVFYDSSCANCES